jgi:hypothetical protein
MKSPLELTKYFAQSLFLPYTAAAVVVGTSAELDDRRRRDSQASTPK